MDKPNLTKKPVRGNVKFMDRWTPWNRIAFGSLSITALLTAINTAAKEGTALSNWLPSFLKIYVLGYGPLIFFLIATALFVIELRRKKTVTMGDRLTVIPVIPPPQASLTKPKKFYSDRNKSDLADALTDLSEILNKHGADISKKAQYIPNIWNLPSDRISPQDITNLIAELNDITGLAEKLYQQIYGDNGIMNGNIVYRDELCDILQARAIPANNTYIPNNSIRIFKVNIKPFVDELKTIQLAVTHDDRNLINAMIANSKTDFTNFLSAVRELDVLIKETQNRINTFRIAQLS